AGPARRAPGGRLRRARGLPARVRSSRTADAQGALGHRRALETVSLHRRVVSLARREREARDAQTGEDTENREEARMSAFMRSILFGSLIARASIGPVAAEGQPEGQLTVAFDASIAPTFLDPAETPGIGTPFVFLYAIHDALIKPLPGNDTAPCLAESWKEG